MNKDGISVIIITYNNEDTIKKCLNSILKYSPRSEILIVDNNSQDKTKEVIKEYGDKVILIESNENLGFAKGNNFGIQKASGNFLVFLNPDTTLTEDNCLLLLKEVLEQNPEYGIIGPKLIYPNGKTQLTVRNLPTAFRAFAEYILGIKRAYDFYEPKCERFCEVESVVGACMMIPKKLFEEIRGFDKRFFMYFEDLAICKTVKEKGYKIGYFPEVAVKHIVGQSGRQQPTSEFLISSAKKYHGVFKYYLISMIIRVGQIIYSKQFK
ncbi:MAG: glycosyltransferase family 2 protein [Candidatus Daviesbacteria bacterium]